MEPAAPPAASGPWEPLRVAHPWEPPGPARAAPAAPISAPGLELPGAPCLGFHSIFLGFGLQGYTPTSNPSSHSCFQRKKNTVKRGCSDFWAVFKADAALGAARPALPAGSAPARADIPGCSIPVQGESTSPRQGQGVGEQAKGFKEKNWEFGVVIYTGLHSNLSAEAGFFGNSIALPWSCAGSTRWPRRVWGCCPRLWPLLGLSFISVPLLTE